MRAVIQRVAFARLYINGEEYSSIESGLLILLGITDSDTKEDIDWLVKKVRQMRIFEDEEAKMNLSVEDTRGEILIVSQFTLHASTKKGNRPSFIRAAKPEIAIPLYEQFIHTLKQSTSVRVTTGSFGAMMDIEFVNTGPVTIIIDSKNRE